jgi:hypothetical protein
VRVDQRGEGLGVQEWDVAGGHHDDAVEVVGQRRQPAQRGVPGAQLVFLYGHLDGSAQLVGQLADDRGDAFAVLAEYHDEVLGCDLRDGVQGVREHAAPAEAVQHLGGVGTHPGSGAGGQHQHGRMAVCGHSGLPSVRFRSRHTVFTVRNRTVALMCECSVARTRT